MVGLPGASSPLFTTRSVMYRREALALPQSCSVSASNYKAVSVCVFGRLPVSHSLTAGQRERAGSLSDRPGSPKCMCRFVASSMPSVLTSILSRRLRFSDHQPRRPDKHHPVTQQPLRMQHGILFTDLCVWAVYEHTAFCTIVRRHGPQSQT